MDKTISLAARVDICSIATLAKAYTIERMFMRSKSDILWQAVEQLSALYCRKLEIQPFEDIQEAIDFMDSINLSLRTNDRVRRSLVKAAGLQAIQKDFGDIPIMRVTKGQKKDSEPLYRDDRDEYETACVAFRKSGLVPISFEKFLENRQRLVEEKIDVDTVDQQEFARKEAEKLAELKRGLAAGPSIKN